MIFLYVLLGILLFFAFLLSIRGRVILEMKDGELHLAVKVLFLTFRIAPAKEPKPVKIKDFTPKKYKKRLRRDYREYLKKQEKKEQKEAAKKEKKERKKAEKQKDKPPKRSILDWVNLSASVLSVLFKKFFKHLRIKVARLHINVATGDAASTAILYGVIIQSVTYIIEILNSATNLKGLKKADISVNADYLSESTAVDMKFIFSLRVWHIFSILFGVLGRAIKKLIETSPDKSSSSGSPLQSPQSGEKKEAPDSKREKNKNNI